MSATHPVNPMLLMLHMQDQGRSLLRDRLDEIERSLKKSENDRDDRDWDLIEMAAYLACAEHHARKAVEKLSPKEPT